VLKYLYNSANEGTDIKPEDYNTVVQNATSVSSETSSTNTTTTESNIEKTVEDTATGL
jgi:hypothetical protein